MIRVLVSDLGNVLLPFDDGPPRRQIAAACDVPDARAKFDALEKACGLSRGLIAPPDFHALLVKQLGLRLSFADFSRVLSDMFTEDGAMLALVANAKVEQRVLLSNTNAIHWQWIVAHHAPLLALFDHVVTSHETHLEKPDAAIFQHVCALTGHTPDSHLFIDDLSVHVAGARRAGFMAELFSGAAQLVRTPSMRSILV